MNDEDFLNERLDAGFGTVICNSCEATITVMVGRGMTGYEFGEACIDLARLHGWVRVGVLDYCAKCAPHKVVTN